MVRFIFYLLLTCGALPGFAGTPAFKEIPVDTPACHKPVIKSSGPITFCEGGSVNLSSSDATAERFVSTIARFSNCDFGGLPCTCGAGRLSIDSSGKLYVGVCNGMRTVTLSGLITKLKANYPFNRDSSVIFGRAGRFVFNKNSGTYFSLYSSNAATIYICKLRSDGFFDTLAGGLLGYADGKGSTARFQSIQDMIPDADGNIILLDYNRVRKITPAGVVTTLAGRSDSKNGYLNGPALSAEFYGLTHAVQDDSGNIYLSDALNRCIRKLSPTGIVSTFAGDTVIGYEDGPANEARFYFPGAMDIDGVGNLYVCDGHNERICRITPEGVVKTIAGKKPAYLETIGGYIDGSALSAKFDGPSGIVHDNEGNLYVSDAGNSAVRKISFASSSYIWSNGASTQSINVTRPGMYTVQTVSNGCTSLPSEPVFINVLPLPASPGPPVSLTNTTACPGYMFSLQGPVLPEGESYLWSNGDTNRIVMLSSEGSLSLRAKGKNGCLSPPSPVINISFRRPSLSANNPLICPHQTDSLKYIVSGLPGSAFQWQVTGGILLSASGSMALVSWQTEPGPRLLTVTETDSSGCIEPPVQLLITYDSLALLGCDITAYPINIPNVITPNGDVYNENLFISNLDLYPGNRLQVYNRWGKSVFEAQPYKNNWGAENLPAGTYFCLLSNGRGRVFKSSLTVIK
ncbi:MAG: gliding motility-associated C-terminal domain-containing protein [Bacteroidota bacterium]